MDEKMETVIFTVGNNVRIAASFSVKKSGIDYFYDQALKLLAKELKIPIERVLALGDFQKSGIKEKLRIMYIRHLVNQDQIKNEYNLVEFVCQNVPNLKRVRENTASYKENRTVQIIKAEEFALCRNYDEAAKILNHYSLEENPDMDIILKLFLCLMVENRRDECLCILHSFGPKVPLMDRIYKSYSSHSDANFASLIDETEDKFLATMLRRIKTNVNYIPE